MTEWDRLTVLPPCLLDTNLQPAAQLQMISKLFLEPRVQSYFLFPILIVQ